MARAVLTDQRIVHLSAEEAVARLPDAVTDAGVRIDIDLAQPARGTATPGAQRFPATWRAGRSTGVGHVEVGALSAQASVVEVALPAGVARNHAEALRDRIEGRPAQPAVVQPARRGVPRLAVAGLVVVLVAVGLPVLQALTRPQPVSVELATERYRAAAPPEPVASAPPAPPPAQVAEPTARQQEPDAPARPPTAPEAPPPPAPAPQTEEPAAATVPEPGVYRYATTGWEELSMPGSRRTFPSETAQTVTHTPCGFQVAWQPLEERADAFELCVSDGRAVLASVTTYRSFFGHAHEQRFTCTEVPSPDDVVWSVRCSDEDATTMEVTARLEGRATLDVAGQPVETLRLRMDSLLEGDTTGTRRALMWFREGDGLVVRTEVSSDLRVQGPFGPLRYREEHSLHLADLTAHR